MINHISTIFVLLAVSIVATVGILSITNPYIAYADDLRDACNEAKANDPDGQWPAACKDYNLGKVEGNNPASNPGRELLNSIIDIIAFAAGALAVIFLIFGGFRYVKSGGDSNKVTEAKNMIVYALVGIIVVAIARQLIQFVLNRLL